MLAYTLGSPSRHTTTGSTSCSASPTSLPTLHGIRVGLDWSVGSRGVLLAAGLRPAAATGRF